MRVWDMRIQSSQPLHHASVTQQIWMNPRNLANNAEVFGAETSTSHQSKYVSLMVQVSKSFLERDGCNDIQRVKVHIFGYVDGLAVMVF